jgi:hypothetical protein
LIQHVNACFAVELEVELARPNLVAESENTVSVLREERIPEDDMRARLVLANLFQFVGNVAHRAGTKSGKNPMRAICTEFRTATACQNRDAAEAAVAAPPVPLAKQIPPGKRERVEVGDRETGIITGKPGPGSKAGGRLFWFADHQKVSVVAE